MNLTGQHIVITRPREKADGFAARLRELGAVPVVLPTIQITAARDPGPLDRALQRLERYHWMVLTSAHGVDAVWDRLRALSIPELPISVRVAAIGPKTADRLRAHGVEAHFVPGTYIAEAVAPGLGDLHSRRVLLPVADIANDTLANTLLAAGARPEVVTAYHTVPADPPEEALGALRAGVDVVTFTSGSTVRNFVAVVEAAGIDPQGLPGEPRIACIGPKTARVVAEAGLTPDIVSDEHTVDGLIAALLSFRSSPVLEENV